MQRKELERKEGFESIVPVKGVNQVILVQIKIAQAVTASSFTLGLTCNAKQTFRNKLSYLKSPRYVRTGI